MSNNDFNKWVSEVQQWTAATDQIPVKVRDDIAKGRHKPEEPKNGFKSFMWDPLTVQYSMGYKDRKYSLTYDTLKRIPQQLSVIAAIIQTRQNQIASFSAPFRMTKSLGYVVKHKDPGKLTTKGEREMIKDLEQFVYNCGAEKPNPHNKFIKRDDFETFLKKLVRDSLTYDQCAFEIVPDRRGVPYEFMAVDAATLRIAANNDLFGPNDTWEQRVSSSLGAQQAMRWSQQPHSFNPYSTLKLYGNKDPHERPAFVQVINGQIENIYTHDDLAFGIRNPRTDLYIQGYGYGELEQLITVVTSHLYAEEYNRRFFMQGSAPKGLLNLKGDNMSPDQLESFKRQWSTNMEGITNAWRTPIFQSEQGVEWIDLAKTNQEMEFNTWIEYLIKISCFTENAPITMADCSLKPISEIQPGEYVRTLSGASNKVVNVQVTAHDGDLHHIRAGEVMEVTGEHPLYVSSSTFHDGVRNILEPSWVSAKDVVEGRDYLCVPKKTYAHGTKTTLDLTNYLEAGSFKVSEDGTRIAPKANRVTWINKEIPLTSENAFVLGLYMSEGNATDYASFFTFAKHETAYVDDVLAFAGRMGCHAKPYSAKESTANVRVHSSLLAQALGNAFGSGAAQKCVPSELMNAPESVKKAFFSGVFAGDGSVPDFASGAAVATISLVSKNGIEQLRSMLLSLDVYAHKYAVVSTGFSTGTHSVVSNQYRLDVSGSQASKLATWLLGTKGALLQDEVAGKRLHSKIYENDSYFFVPVSETWVTKYSGNVYNLEVENEHTYQAYRFGVHNCAVFLIDPAEINFDVQGGVSQTPLFESSSEWKLKASRDRGLKPLLRFLAKMINDNVIAKIDDHFVFDFVGLDELTEQEKHELRKEQVASYMTLNEIRRAEDLPDVLHGDLVLNPSYLQGLQVVSQMEQAQQAQGQAPPGQGGEAPAAPQDQEQSTSQKDNPAPSYSDNFTKSITAISGDKYLEISLDDWLTEVQ